MHCMGLFFWGDTETQRGTQRRRVEPEALCVSASLSASPSVSLRPSPRLCVYYA